MITRLATLGMLFLVSITPRGLGQDKEQSNRVAELEKRVVQLEQRLVGLERLLDGRYVPSVSNAQSRLAAAEHRLQYSQRLYSKGYLTRAQLKTDELEFARARIEMLRIRDGRVDQKSAREIEILAAETKLAVCQDLLRYAERRASTEEEVRAWKLRVEEARKELERAKAQPQAAAKPNAESQEN